MKKNIFFIILKGFIHFLSFATHPWEFMATFGNAIVNVVLFWFYGGKKNVVVKIFSRFMYSVSDYF